MLKRILLGGSLLLAFQGTLFAMDEIDSFVLNHCESRCNGENRDCGVCYSQAVELFDQPQSMSREDLDINLDAHQGAFEFKF